MPEPSVETSKDAKHGPRASVREASLVQVGTDIFAIVCSHDPSAIVMPIPDPLDYKDPSNLIKYVEDVYCLLLNTTLLARRAALVDLFPPNISVNASTI